MDLFNRKHDNAITYDEFIAEGWTDEAYIYYCKTCASIRALTISVDSIDNNEEFTKQLRASLRNMIDELLNWLSNYSGLLIALTFDVANALIHNAQYIRDCEYESIGAIPDVYRSEEDFREEIERLIYNLLTDNTDPIMYSFPMCETKARTKLLLDDSLDQRKQLLDRIAACDSTMEKLYLWARNKAQAIMALQSLDETIDYLNCRMQEFDNGGDFDVSKNILYVYRGRIKCEHEHHRRVDYSWRTIGR